MLCSGVSAQASGFAGGTGEPNDPYRIANAEQLISIGSDPNLLDKHYVLIDDIDLDPNLPGRRMFTQAVIAPFTDDGTGLRGNAFAGSFDGNGHKIRNLTIHGPRSPLLGLFGSVGEQAVVKNLRLESVKVDDDWSGWRRGALAGANHGRIIGCHVAGRVVGSYETGGLVGANTGQILDCRVDGEVLGLENVGGLVGTNEYGGSIVKCSAAAKLAIAQIWCGGLVGRNEGYITNCYATGDVHGWQESSQLGGLVGRNENMSKILSCYATGDVIVDERGHYIGGLVGTAISSTVICCYATGNVRAGNNSEALGGLVGLSTGQIVHSYATGTVQDGEKRVDIGGLVGRKTRGSIDASFWNIETSSLSESAGGTGLTTAQMQDIQTFLTAGWDFAGEFANGTADTWLAGQPGGYPELALLSDAYEPHKLAGNGTADDPYKIATPLDLGAVWHHESSGYYRLIADIDLGGITWRTAPITYVTGEFDGARHVISNVTISGSGLLGLFARVDADAVVKDLGITDVNITGGRDAGFVGILAADGKGSILNCHVEGRLSVGDGGHGLGGLVGCCNDGIISQCRSTADLVGGRECYEFGGLVGLNLRGSVSDCYAVADIVGGEKSRALGGLIGNDLSGTIGTSYAVSGVTGGLDSTALGSLIGSEDTHSKITACYFLGPDAGTGPVDNGIGIPLTDTQMKQQASFVGWDFERTWMICEGKDYAHLRWENVQCDK